MILYALFLLLTWDVTKLFETPRVFPAETAEPGVKALYYESVPWRGKPTRVFAYYGAPAGKKLPAMVLIHGGGGTAFAEWVRMWNARGYAAIAMDTGGMTPERAAADKLWNPARAHHEGGGPAGWGGFNAVDEPKEDQWTYHAVAAAVRGHSLLRSMPEVDPERIGVTGISWGGYLTNIVAGIDGRFRFAAPVYGCGYLGEDSAWLKNFAEMGPERAAKWLGWWDPSAHLAGAKMPMLWVTGTNDFAYPLPSLQKSYRLPAGPRTLAVRVRMKHGHPDGAKPEEIFAFAGAMLRKEPALARVVAAERDRVKFRGRIVKAELNYTKAGGKWQEREWVSVPAEIRGKTARAAVPEGATAWYFNLFDAQGRVASSEHFERK
jgi:cephalosporin-C deacetylase-like acetyl esterase